MKALSLLCLAILLGIAILIFMPVSKAPRHASASKIDSSQETEASLQAASEKRAPPRKDYEIRDYMSMKYKLVKPASYDASKSYPLLLSLHGGVPEKPLADKPSPEGDSAFGMTRRMKDAHPCFILIPKASRPWWDGGKDKSLLAEIKSFVDSVLTQEFSIDKTRIYLVGHSDGGTGILHALYWYPGYFAGAVPMSGWISGDMDPKRIASCKTPLWWFIARKDDCPKWETTDRILKAVLKGKGMARVSIVTNGNHGSTCETFDRFCRDETADGVEELVANDAMDAKSKNPVDWLFSQKQGGSFIIRKEDF